MLTMAAVFLVTWIGLALIGIQSSFILGIQAGLLAFIPTVGALLGRLIVVLASLASGWVAALSAFILFLGVHALESYVLTPIIQRQALDIPPATLFAFQILLGVVFGIWGLALALPLMAIVKVMIDYFKADEAPPETVGDLDGVTRPYLDVRRSRSNAQRYQSRCARPRAARQNTGRPGHATP